MDQNKITQAKRKLDEAQRLANEADALIKQAFGDDLDSTAFSTQVNIMPDFSSEDIDLIYDHFYSWISSVGNCGW